MKRSDLIEVSLNSSGKREFSTASTGTLNYPVYQLNINILGVYPIYATGLLWK
jgi:hypothetical protein